MAHDDPPSETATEAAAQSAADAKATAQTAADAAAVAAMLRVHAQPTPRQREALAMARALLSGKAAKHFVDEGGCDFVGLATDAWLCVDTVLKGDPLAQEEGAR